MLLPDPQYVSELLEKTRELTALAPVRERSARLAKDYARGIATEERALVVALIGSTGAGKSTLLNALAGRNIAMEGENRPTTSTAVVYAPEDAAVGALSAQGARVERYEVRPGAVWSGQVFIDAPDFNSVAAEHADRARAVVDAADVALVVMHKGSVAEAVQADFLSEFARRRRLVFVLNAADQYAPETRETLKLQTKQLAQSRLGLKPEDVEVFAISALEYKRGRDATGELPSFLDALKRLGERTTAEKVRRSNALGALREMQSLVRPALERSDLTHQQISQELGEGLASVRQALDADFTARLEASAGHLATEIRQEAASRFWGPAAWGMRLSLVGTSGIGAATLLARGNPLIAGGVALGSAIAGRVQQAAAARSAERRVLTSGSTEETLVQASRAALSGARSTAAAEGLSMERLGLPNADELVGTLQRVREEAWSHTTGTATAQAVQRWWKTARWLLLPLVNLPLLVLFAHVAYRVVRGYLEGSYVGLDFLLNAAALAGLLSLAGAGLASISLYGVRRRVIAAGRERFLAALANVSGELVHSAERGEEAPREAARRLMGLASEENALPSDSRRGS